MKTTPPMVGVPFLARWHCGPISRIGWSARSLVNALMAMGVPKRETRNEMAAATMTALMPSQSLRFRCEAVASQGVGNVPRTVTRTLDQHDVAGPQLLAQQRDGLP
jgi:hypothetical protein